MLVVFNLLIVAIVIGIYVAFAIFLNKFNKLIYGRNSAMAWLPIFNIYLLGKLTINKLTGWCLIIVLFLTSTYTITINGVENTYTILPENINNIVSTLYSLVVLGLIIYACVKYNKLKSENSTGATLGKVVSLKREREYREVFQRKK